MKRVGGAEVQRHVLVDGNNLVHRAQAVYIDMRLKEGRPLLSGPKGYPTGVIYGSLSFLASWLYDITNPTRISIFFDGVPKRRLQLDSHYKEDRDASKKGLKLTDPSGTGVRFPLLMRDGYDATCEVDVLARIFQILGCDVYHDPDEEADDLIASFVNQHQDAVNIIISDDKDFFQLLTNPRVVIYRPGSKDTRFFDAEAAEAHWTKFNKGKHPRIPVGHVRMFKSLCGDASDCIIGVERLRKNVAATLCHHPDIDSLYSSGFPGFSDSEKSKTLEMKERIALNYQLVGFYDNLDLSKSIRPAIPNHTLAGDICREDLHMMKLDLKSFRLGEKPSTEALSIPVDDWLLNI